ncbi:MAG: DUF87 domain-containing protein [Chloroflexi bacterium]|nr:DUF87 domain-containing protein [Chloroflexota bacterium]
MLSDTAKQWFERIIQPDQYVGEVYSISYEKALVQIHDFHRQKVGGIPSLSFLIATRVNPAVDSIDFQLEDSSVILLRVIDAAPLPNSPEAERIRVESAQEVSGEIDTHWDSRSAMDPQTHNLLSFAGISCRVIGTFYLDQNPQDPKLPLVLRFGSDISNYYPNRGLKVFKPNGSALRLIVNYQDPDNLAEQVSKTRVAIGEVRYASTNRAFQGVSKVDVSISPSDLLTQKTALFGMTRTGKSNTTKIIAKSVFNLRFEHDKPLSIGQLIFDPDGEYANENVQDANRQKNPNALKNVWKSNQKGDEKDVITYGVHSHPDDPERKIMLINFFRDENLQIGKEMINAVLAEDQVKYIQNFIQVIFEEPAADDWSNLTRYRRRVLAYRALLAKAGFTIPSDSQPHTKKLFIKELFEGRPKSTQNAFNGMKNVQSDQEKTEEYLNAAKILTKDNPSWDAMSSAFETLHSFLNTDEYKAFENWYINERKDASGEKWADEELRKILAMFHFPNGARQIGKLQGYHTVDTSVDFADEIYIRLKEGKLVIIDQSSGEPQVNDDSARRIMWKIFRGNQKLFREGEEPPDILIYIEEAHTLLPHGSEQNYKDVWVRTAKEGAKYQLGMVYVTQEVSSIQKNILKNTANWFIGHLNNTDETRELRKFYDFADFEKSILRSQNRGFLRVKTLSNLFVIPVQIKRFEV